MCKMYRLLLLTLIFNILDHINGYQEHRRPYCPWPACRRKTYQHPDIQEFDTFKKVLRSHFEADGAFAQYCYEYTTVNPTMMYGFDNLVMTYNVPEEAEFNIDIRIKNNILRTVVIINNDIPDFNSFTDVRVLPNILDFSGAVWSINYGELNIAIPYRMQFGRQFIARCNSGTDNKVILIPMSHKPHDEPETTWQGSLSQEITSGETESREVKSKETESRVVKSEESESSEGQSEESVSSESKSEESESSEGQSKESESSESKSEESESSESKSEVSESEKLKPEESESEE